MYVKCGVPRRNRYVSASSVVAAVEKELCKCLIGMRAFTGCDKVSASTIMELGDVGVSFIRYAFSESSRVYMFALLLSTRN